MTIKPMKFTVKQTVVVDGHEIASGTYVGQKLSETDIERELAPERPGHAPPLS